ncbi:GntR family transcriptional regulator [Nocardiopsis sp. MG754419]|uniref:GntR family transcriptional regulator n=1 Tax=Nocardiopsis sp. MG754419 TaxID=2259865 RepID=UPI001BAA4B2C|nr:GntR family transcriptional regulator [Nocardiopsis sp. MG754419]MBR8741806.1 GntR family transcriptional regulator [Nocardiopsis sp. MG754419]
MAVNSGESAYQRVARELRTAVLGGRFDDGSRLPTEAELADLHGVSRQTVRRAFQDLVAEGLVHRVRGRGTYPTRNAGRYLRRFGSVEDLMALSEDTRMVVLRPLRRRVDLDVAGRLRLETDTVHSVDFRRDHDGHPFCVTTVHLPPWVGARLDDVEELDREGAESAATVIGLLDRRLAHPVAEAEQSITAVAAPSEVVRDLGCAEEAPLLRVDRTYLDTRGAVVELATSHFLPEQYSYRLRLRRGAR